MHRPPIPEKNGGEGWSAPPEEGEFGEHEGDTEGELLLQKVRKGLQTHVPACK